MSRLTDYLKDTRGELKHVSWPSKKQVIVFTVVIIAFSFIVAAFLGAFDILFAYFLKLFIS
jgi:preprotein translocase subunit SecE